MNIFAKYVRPDIQSPHIEIAVDPDKILPTPMQHSFRNLLETYDDVFDPTITGYNGAAGPFEAVVNMGPVQPPQRKGRLPQCPHNELVELQQKFDDLEAQGVFHRPEDIGVTLEYLNSSFLVTKPTGDHRLATADGLAPAIHIKLDHPSKHQLQLVMKRHFYALDLPQVIERVCDTCHTCTSLCQLPEPLKVQTTEDPPAVVGTSFAADVLKRNKQAILVLRETSTSYTVASIVPDEKTNSLRETIARLCLDLRPIRRPPVTVRVDPAPGFVALKEDPTLKQLGIFHEIGRIKNINKNVNPVAEKAISELEND